MKVPPSLICVLAWALVLQVADPATGALAGPLMLLSWYLARIITNHGRLR